MTPLRLIWPPRELRPNARLHYMAKARVTRQYRTYARAVARKAALEPHQGPMLVRMTFCPPDRRARDLDNAQASAKAALDGIADALGTNDRLFRPLSEWGEVDPAGLGYLLVEIEPWEREARPIGEIITPIMAEIAERVERAA